MLTIISILVLLLLSLKQASNIQKFNVLFFPVYKPPRLVRNILQKVVKSLQKKKRCVIINDKTKKKWFGGLEACERETERERERESAARSPSGAPRVLTGAAVGFLWVPHLP